MKKVGKIIILSVIVILLILVILFSIKFCTVNSILNNMAENNNLSNLHITKNSRNSLTEAENDVETIVDIYLKDDNRLFVMNGIKWYVNYNDTAYIVIDEEKSVLENKYAKDYGRNVFESFINDFDEISLKDKLKYCIDWKISNVEIENVKYYYIEKENNQYWVNKDTFFIEKEIIVTSQTEHSEETITYVETKIEQNTVTDEQMKLPDFSEYTITNT